MKLKLNVKKLLELISDFRHLAIAVLIWITVSSATPSTQNFKSGTDFPSTITVENSMLPSNNVCAVYIDSTNVAWIGTDKGLARFDGNEWQLYSTDNFLKDNQVNDITFDETDKRKELLVATNNGLTIALLNSNGIESATTYDTESSSLQGKMVNNIAVDPHHNRWIGTETGVNVFSGDVWNFQSSAFDGADESFNFSEFPITDIAVYNFDSLTLVSTKGKGVARMRYNEVDGFTGASTLDHNWSSISSNKVMSIAVNGETQWFGTDAGVSKHTSRFTKNDWESFSTENHLLDNHITAIAIDKLSNIWLGTSKGLSILTEDGKVLKFTETEGLVNNQVNTITTDLNGNVWVGTAGGIQWFAKNPGVDATTSNALLKTKNKVQVYPNPVKDWLHIEIDIDKPQQIKVSVYNMHGQLIDIPFEKQVNSNHMALNFSVSNKSVYSKGLYILRIDTRDNVQIIRLNIE